MPPQYRQGNPNRYGAYRPQDEPLRQVNPALLRTAKGPSAPTIDAGYTTNATGGTAPDMDDWFTQNEPPAAGPTAPPAAETPAEELKRFEDHYHAPDKEAVLARLRARIAGPGAASPAGGGTWDANRFAQQFGQPNTVAELLALEDRLKAAGISVERNAAGVAGKIKLPNGQVIDVLKAAGLGGQGFQWDDGGGGGGGGGAPMPQGFRPGELENTGLTAPYTPQPYTGGTYQAPEWTEQFTAPTIAQAEAEPGYKFALEQGLQGLERGAAARGSVLSGGTQKALNRYGAQAAAQNYGQVYNRAAGEYDTRRQNFMGNVGLGQQNYGNRYGEYSAGADRAYQAHIANQANRVGAIGRWWDINQRTADRGLSATR